MSKKPRGLGSGFAALLSDKAVLSPEEVSGDALMHLPLPALVAGRFQPRTQWDDVALTELAESIKAQGVVQPIVVRSMSGGQYEIIAGERRWRAAKLAGLAEIPAVVRAMDDQQALAIALIENIQRENLTAIEEARAMRKLADSFQLTHEQLAQTLGRSREAVSNLLRLLKLELSVQESVLEGQLSAGHARALLALPEDQQKPLAQQAMSQAWSVRELEQVIRQRLQGETSRPEAQSVNSQFVDWQNKLTGHLGLKVKLTGNAQGKGKVEIAFKDKDQLEMLMRALLQDDNI